MPEPRSLAVAVHLLHPLLDVAHRSIGGNPSAVEVWKIGSDLLFITLGGEVVIDYALRLKEEFGAQRTWVAGYTNDVMAYVPSRRVPASWAP